MKKTYETFLLTVIIFANALTALSQITINTNDITNTGFTFYYGVLPTPGSSVNIGGTGAQTWNYSPLTAASEDTLVFIAPSLTPYAAGFTGSNLCMRLGTSDNYYYYTNNTDSLVSNGDALNDFFTGAVIRTYTPALEVLEFPATYPYNKTYSTFRYGRFAYTGAVIDSLEEKKYKDVEINIDAYGSMTTSFGTKQVLRIKETIFSNDTTFKHDTSNGWQFMNNSRDTLVNYTWWADSIGWPLAMAQCNYVGAIQWIKWLKNTPVHTGLKKYTETGHNINIFPSPANDEITILVDSAVSQISIINSLGVVCENININNLYNLKLNTGHLPTGLYFLNTFDTNHHITTTKFVISR